MVQAELDQCKNDICSYSEALLPSHPSLKLVANSEQCLSKHVSRRLITMEKIREHKVSNTIALHEEWKE